MGWDQQDHDHPWSPKSIARYAHQLRWATDERKKFLYNSDDKIMTAKRIVEKFKVPTITFAETTAFVDNLVRELGDISRPYHTNLKGQKVVEKRTALKSPVV